MRPRSAAAVAWENVLMMTMRPPAKLFPPPLLCNWSEHHGTLDYYSLSPCSTIYLLICMSLSFPVVPAVVLHVVGT